MRPPETLPVADLIKEYNEGQLKLPEIQRGYVWKTSQICKLLDSLYRGYPTGSILVWEADRDTPVRDSAVEQKNNHRSRFLLDGQQRVTSLIAALKDKPIKVKGRKEPVKVEILFNLNHSDDLKFNEETGREDVEKATFVVAQKKFTRLPHWVKVADVFKADNTATFLLEHNIFDHPDRNKYLSRLGKLMEINKYVYKVDVLSHDLDEAAVTDIFVRVNSSGTKLKGSDLALAQITSIWKNSLKKFEKQQETYNSKQSFPMDMGILVRNLIAYATGQCKFHRVRALSAEQLQEDWEKSIKGMDFAIHFVQNNAKISSPTLLSSPYILITLAAYGMRHGYRVEDEDIKKLYRWVMMANARGRYSWAASETVLDEDLRAIKKGGGVDELISTLEQRFGRLDISVENLKGSSYLLKCMFMAFKSAKAKDWLSGLEITMSSTGASHKLEGHHIFPRALLKKHGGYQSKEINDISNLAFISMKTNREIGKRPPAEYIPEFCKKRGAEIFVAQCIPHENPELLKLESYPKFLEERRKRITKRLNEFLNPSW